MSKPHIPVLDSLRAFAALSVCLYHFGCTTTSYMNGDWFYRSCDLGQYGVQMFFVISGFIIPWAMYKSAFEWKNIGSFLLKRFVRLEPPYIVSLLLAISVIYIRYLYFGKGDQAPELSFSRIALHIGYLIPFSDYTWLNRVYWSLAIEFQYYIFIAIIFAPLIHSNAFTRAMLFSVGLALTFFSGIVWVSFWFPFFLMGILLFLQNVNRISMLEFWSWTILTFLVCFIQYWNYDRPSLIFSGFTMAMILWFKDVKIPGLDTLGKFSYSVYLLHGVVGTTFINFMVGRYTGPDYRMLVIAGGFAVSFLCSYLMYIAIERPSKRLSSRIRYNKQEIITVISNGSN